MYNVKKYKKILQDIKNIKYKIYLYYIRYNINKATKIEHLTNVIKKMSSNKTSTDDISNILVDCFKKYLFGNNYTVLTME